ncbi:MAG: transposase [Segetibacter sp.]
MFTLLFNAASYTLLKFAKDEKYLAAQPGIIAVLHTWGQQLSFHPHVHCIVSGGGITSPPALCKKRGELNLPFGGKKQ